MSQTNASVNDARSTSIFRVDFWRCQLPSSHTSEIRIPYAGSLKGDTSDEDEQWLDTSVVNTVGAYNYKAHTYARLTSQRRESLISLGRVPGYTAVLVLRQLSETVIKSANYQERRRFGGEGGLGGGWNARNVQQQPQVASSRSSRSRNWDKSSSKQIKLRIRLAVGALE